MSVLLPIIAKTSVNGQPCSLTQNSDPFFGLPHWWQYMSGTADGLGGCSPHFTGPGDIFLIALAVLDILLRVAGFLAVVSIIIAAVEYVVSTGNPEKVTNARKRIINSLIGLAIAVVAATTVSFIGRQFG